VKRGPADDRNGIVLVAVTGMDLPDYRQGLEPVSHGMVGLIRSVLERVVNPRLGVAGRDGGYSATSCWPSVFHVLIR